VNRPGWLLDVDGILNVSRPRIAQRPARGRSSRYDERDYMYRAAVDVITMKIRLRDLTRDSG
jgi:hypothetical protein